MRTYEDKEDNSRTDELFGIPKRKTLVDALVAAHKSKMFDEARAKKLVRRKVTRDKELAALKGERIRRELIIKEMINE